MNILQNKFINSEKETFDFKGLTPIYKHNICKYDTRFSITSVVGKVNGVSRANHWNEHKKILKLCSEFVITATVLIPMVIKQQLQLSRKFENTSVREF